MLHLIAVAILGNSPFVVPPPPGVSTTGYEANGACATQVTGDVVCYDNNGAVGGQRTTTTDPDSLSIRPQVCSPSDGTCAASNLIMFGGQDTTTIAIDGADPTTSCAGDNDTVSLYLINRSGMAVFGIDTPEVLTEGTDWTAGTVAATCASLAAAVDAACVVSSVTYCNASCTSPDVRIELTSNAGRLALRESTAGCTTVSTGTPGVVGISLGVDEGGIFLDSGTVLGGTMDNENMTLRAGSGGIAIVSGTGFTPGTTTLGRGYMSVAKICQTTASVGCNTELDWQTGILYEGSFALTAGTFSGYNAGYVRPTWFKLSWTNAMLAACAAGGTCDITIATLPAKTLVKRALLEVTAAATHASTLTMSIGTAAGGTQYVLAGDIKAAANTVYGDSDAEVGASLFDAADDHYMDHLPSWTATQAINARITAGAGDVNSVTTSTGNVYIQVEILP